MYFKTTIKLRLWRIFLIISHVRNTIETYLHWRKEHILVEDKHVGTLGSHLIHHCCKLILLCFLSHYLVKLKIVKTYLRCMNDTIMVWNVPQKNKNEKKYTLRYKYMYCRMLMF